MTPQVGDIVVWKGSEATEVAEVWKRRRDSGQRYIVVRLSDSPDFGPSLAAYPLLPFVVEGDTFRHDTIHGAPDRWTVVERASYAPPEPKRIIDAQGDIWLETSPGLFTWLYPNSGDPSTLRDYSVEQIERDFGPTK